MSWLKRYSEALEMGVLAAWWSGRRVKGKDGVEVETVVPSQNTGNAGSNLEVGTCFAWLAENSPSL